MAKTKVQLPPHDIDSERSILGAIFLSQGSLEKIRDTLRVEDFYINKHQAIYKAILDFTESNPSVQLDLVSFKAFLKSEGKLSDCGGDSAIAELTKGDFIRGNIEFYAEVVKQHSTRRKLIQLSEYIKNTAYSLEDAVDESMDEIDKKFTDITQGGLNASQGYAEINDSFLDDLATTIFSGKQPDAIETGFKNLDRMTGGFKPYEMIVVGARPGRGKTALALNMAQHMLLNGKKVGFFSLEMNAVSLVKRMLSSLSHVSLRKIINHTIEKSQYENEESAEQKQVMDAISIFLERDPKLFIQDIPNMRLLDIRSQARHMRRNHDVDIIFIDYIGLISVDNVRSSAQRHDEIALASRSLKQLARELEIPIVVLSQLNRDAEAKGEPNLSSLRESGAIEQDADVVMFLHRESEIGEENQAIKEVKLILAKQRNGETGAMMLAFDGPVVTFREQARTIN